MSSTKISIVIPTLNEQENIGKIIKKVNEKGTPEISSEIIVADAGSEDKTVEIAKSEGAKIVNCEKMGRASQMNSGAKAAEGTTLYFLHADTIPPSGFDKIIVNSVKKGHLSGCFRLRFDDPHPVMKLYGWFTRFPGTWLRFGDQSLFVDRELFFKIGGFDESHMLMEDQEIVRRLKKVSDFRRGTESVTTSARRFRVNGIIRLQLVFGIILSFYYLGASQSTLVHIYKSLIKK